MRTILEIKDLTYRYPARKGTAERQVLKGLTFTIEKGDIVGILGPNGSGKTTLFKIISTLIEPTSGTVTWVPLPRDGYPGNRPSEIRRSIGVIFQHPSLDGKLSIEENLIHQGHLYGLRGEILMNRISQELKRVDLFERKGDKVDILSGGLQRKVEIIKGMLHSPSLLIMDEPSTGLDPRARKELSEHLKQLKKEGMTILLTTHLIEEAEKCDRLILLNEGAIVASGSPQTIKQEIGEEVIVIETSDPQTLVVKLGQLPLGHSPKTILANTVRIETKHGHEFIPQILDKFGNDILSFTVGKPTLEDLFIHKTGKKFE